MALVNRHRWFFTWSKINGISSRAIEVADGNDGGRRKTLYLSNDGGGTPGTRPPSGGSDALPSGVIVNEWYPKSLCALQDCLNIRVTEAGVASLPALAPNDWYVRTVRHSAYYPNFPVDGRMRKEGTSGDNRVNA